MNRYYTDEDFDYLIKKIEDFILFCSLKNEEDIDECVRYFTDNTSKYLFYPVIPWGDELKFYHIRLNVALEENLESITPFSYCPETHLKDIKIGRLNLKQQAVFYSSISPETCVKEMKLLLEKEKKKKDIAYISTWSTSEKKDFYSLITFSPDFSNLSPDFIEFEKSMISKFSFIGSKKGVDKYLRALGKLMLGDSYIPSAVLANHLFYKVNLSGGKKIDCIIYPSVQEKNEIVYDFAFTPISVDKFLTLKRIDVGELYKEETFKCCNSIFGIMNGTVIYWYKPEKVPYEKIDFIDCTFNYTEEMKNLNLAMEDIKLSLLDYCNSNKEDLPITLNTEYSLSSPPSVNEKRRNQIIAIGDEFELDLNGKEVCITKIRLTVEYTSSYCRIYHEGLYTYIKKEFTNTIVE